MLKVISFDFWNTLVRDKSYNDSRIDLLKNHLTTIGYSRSTAEIKDAFIKVTKLVYAGDRTNGAKHYQIQQIFDDFCKLLKVNITPDQKSYIITDLEEKVLEDPPVLHNNALEVVKELSNHYQIGLISDTGITPGRIIHKVLAGHGISKYIEFFSFSDETGYCKPHPKAFLPLIDFFQVKPYEVVHIGDLKHTDILGAKKQGFHTIHINHSQFTHHDYPDFQNKDMNAEFEIESLIEVPQIIQSINKNNKKFREIRI
ncbi:MAG: HAD family hydrolase [Promethearchaeota archaeon]